MNPRPSLLAPLLLLPILLTTGCTGVPEGIAPVRGFDAERYLGTWHEIVRLDHSFERGLEQVTATYSRRDDGGLAVLNRDQTVRGSSPTNWAPERSSTRAK